MPVDVRAREQFVEIGHRAKIRGAGVEDDCSQMETPVTEGAACIHLFDRLEEGGEASEGVHVHSTTVEALEDVAVEEERDEEGGRVVCDVFGACFSSRRPEWSKAARVNSVDEANNWKPLRGRRGASTRRPPCGPRSPAPLPLLRRLQHLQPNRTLNVRRERRGGGSRGNPLLLQ